MTGSATIIGSTSSAPHSASRNCRGSRLCSRAAKPWPRATEKLLAGIPGISVLRAARSTSRLSWFAYIIRLAPDIDRDRVIAQLERRNIPSRVYFSPIHLQPLYRERFGYREGDFPIAERVAASTLALPFHGNMPDEHIACVAEALAAVVRAAA